MNREYSAVAKKIILPPQQSGVAAEMKKAGLIVQAGPFVT